jgi:hypothetical protein
MLKVDPKSVSMNVIGQSGLLNHQVCVLCRDPVPRGPCLSSAVNNCAGLHLVAATCARDH